MGLWHRIFQGEDAAHLSQAHICTHGDDRTPAEVSRIDGGKPWGPVGQDVCILSVDKSQWDI